MDISSPASPSSGLIIAGGNRAAGKKVPSWKIVFLVGSGNRFLMISDDFWWFRMISDDFCIKRLQGCKSGFNSPAKASVKGPMASENFSDTCGQVVMASQNDFHHLWAATCWSDWAQRLVRWLFVVNHRHGLATFIYSKQVLISTSVFKGGPTYGSDVHLLIPSAKELKQFIHVYTIKGLARCQKCSNVHLRNSV